MRDKQLTLRLIHKIGFLENSSTSALDEPKWEKRLEVFAEVKPYCDNKFLQLENMDFGNVITEEYCLFKIAFIQEVNKNMRIDFCNKIFEIKRLINDYARNKILKIIALEI